MTKRVAIIGVCFIAFLVYLTSRDHKLPAPPASTPISQVAPGAVTPAPPRSIPGLNPSDVYGNFTSKGFDLDRQAGAWLCTDKKANGFTRTVYLAGTPSSVSYVTAKVMSPLNGPAPARNLSPEFFGFVASLPYDGAEPERARKWATEMAGRNESIVIGGVELVSEAKELACILTMRPASTR